MSGHEGVPKPDEHVSFGAHETDPWVLGAELHEEVMREELSRAGIPEDDQATLDHAASEVELRKQQTGSAEK